MADQYGIRDDYVARSAPLYDDRSVEGDFKLTWQPDVYRDAARLARMVSAPAIVDVGSGDGEKLMAAAAAGRLAIGLDFGLNLTACQARFPSASWRRFDADGDEGWPLESHEIEGAIVVCADVVEHLVDPDPLMEMLRSALDLAASVIVSTPDRARLPGRRSLGPPANPHHIREWTSAEFVIFLRSHGFEHGVVRPTREHNLRHDCRTIEAILVSDSAELRAYGLADGRPGLNFGPPDCPMSTRALALMGNTTRRLAMLGRRLGG